MLSIRNLLNALNDWKLHRRRKQIGSNHKISLARYRIAELAEVINDMETQCLQKEHHNEAPANVIKDAIRKLVAEESPRLKTLKSATRQVLVIQQETTCSYWNSCSENGKLQRVH
ncbi:hypothetical protein Tco_1316281 [Tanacetum coccineum]